jgi:hypothetical protein
MSQIPLPNGDITAMLRACTEGNRAAASGCAEMTVKRDRNISKAWLTSDRTPINLEKR